MKRKWKSDNRWSMFKVKGLVFALFIFAFASCNKVVEEKHFSTKTGDLGGLEQAANQTVFSDIKTISAIEKTIVPIIKATGVVAYDPNLINNISARFSGRIEKLYVRFNFETVIKGQRIMDIYSPEILSEQQNLIFLLSKPSEDANLINSSKQKLRLYGVTNEQLRQIEMVRQPINPLPVYSLYSGHIHDIGITSGFPNSGSGMGSSGMTTGGANSLNKTSQGQIENLPSSQTSALSIKEGMYVERGQPIFAVFNTERVWAVLNIFPEDARLIKVGDKVSLTSETNPGHLIDAVINYIEPVAGLNASAIKARVYLKNEKEHHLKIGTLLMAEITSKEVMGVWLKRKALVNLGQKQIVFLKANNYFIAKPVNTGFVSDSLVQIVKGLNAGEIVAANAQYMVDSESFISTNENE